MICTLKEKTKLHTKAFVNDVKFFAVLVVDWVKEKAESGCNSWRQEQLGIRDDSLFNQLELLKKMPRPLCIFLPPLHLSQKSMSDSGPGQLLSKQRLHSCRFRLHDLHLHKS